MVVVIRSMLATMVLSFLLPLSSQAAEVEEREKILKRVGEITANRAAFQKAMEGGRERIQFCSNCHGEDGNSTRPDIPNLASQNPSYMVEQFQHFQTGVRKDFVMQTLAKQFSVQDKINISIYFSSKRLKRIKVDESKAAAAENIYQTICVRCHGPDGRGETGYARVAGQKPAYVIKTLKRFRSNAKDSAAGKPTDRTNILMEQVTARLTDEEIESLAYYLATL